MAKARGTLAQKEMGKDKEKQQAEAGKEFREEYKQTFGCYPDEPATPREINAAWYERESQRRHWEQALEPIWG